jgi:hypothetical protein
VFKFCDVFVRSSTKTSPAKRMVSPFKKSFSCKFKKLSNAGLKAVFAPPLP